MKKLLIVCTYAILSFSLLALPTLEEINTSFNKISKRYNIPAELLKAFAFRKSAWYPNALSKEDSKGQYGIMGLSQDAISYGTFLLGEDDNIDAIIDYKRNIEIAAILINETRDNFFRQGKPITKIEDYAPIILNIAYPKYQNISKYFTQKVFKLMKEGYTVKLGKEILKIDGIDIDESYTSYNDIQLFYTNYQNINSLSEVPHRWSPNKHDTRYGVKVDQVLIHIMLGRFEGAESWFMNTGSEVSAHYLVSDAGEILQMVRLNHRAWHAGSHNSRSVGIEHEGYWYSPRFRKNHDGWLHPDTEFTEEEYRASALLTSWLCEKYNIPIVHRDAYHSADGNSVPYQLQRPELKNLPGILGHWDTNGKENCPGENFNWEYYLSLVSGSDSSGEITVLYPQDGDTVDNPVNFRSIVTGDIAKVKYFADGQYLLGESNNAEDNFSVDYQFHGIGLRNVSAKGYDSDNNYIYGSEVKFDITIIEAGTGTVRFVKPLNNSISPNPVIFKSNSTGDVDEVKYFVENNYYLGSSSNKNNNYHYERVFTQPGNRTLYARGYKNGVEINGAFEKIEVNILEEGHCQDECNNINEKSCSGNKAYKCIEENGCKKLSLIEECSANESCSNGYCSSNCQDECNNVNEKSCSGNKSYKCIEENGCNKKVLIDICSDSQTCDNGECVGGTSCENECSNIGDRICNGSKRIMKCIDNGVCKKWIEIDICIGNQICNNGECDIEESCDECENIGDKKCSSNNEISQCALHEGCKKWKIIESCNGNNICQNGECKDNQSCQNTCLNAGDKKCIEDRVLECVLDGECNKWQEEKTCTGYQKCRDGECKELNSNCTPGHKLCGNKKEIYMCNELNHIYAPFKKCEKNQVCKLGECILDANYQIPKESGSSCNYSNSNEKELILFILLFALIIFRKRKEI